MKSPGISLVALLVLAGVSLSSGCNSSNSPDSSSGAPAAAKPLEGNAPTKAGQLLGTWFPVTEGGDFPGLELMKDGKAMIGDGSTGITGDYSVLEGGRLSLVFPGGMTTVFEAVIASDQLELKGQPSILGSGGTQRFRRLKAGQTLAEARKEQQAARAREYQARVAALETFLKQPGLVLAFGETGPSTSASMALEVESTAGQFSGKVWHDDKPPHLNAISGQLNLDEASRRAQVVVTFGRRLAPPAAQADGGGQITLSVEGDGKNLRISSRVTTGAGPAQELVLRSDPKLHSEIVKRYEAELARIESMKQPLIKLLRDHAVLSGRLQPADARKTEPDTTELSLARDPKSGQYSCEGFTIGMRDRGEPVSQAAAEIVVVNDKGWLRIVCPPAREYMLALQDEKANKLRGQWAPPGSPQGKGAEFEVVEALDVPAREAKFESRRAQIKAIQADSVFTGLAFEDSGFGLEMPIAFRLQITVRPDGTVSGKAEYPTLATVMTVGGKLAETPFGPVLQLSYTAAESTPGDKIFLRSIQNGTWRLVPAAGAGPLRLTGYFTGPPLRPAVLTLVQEASTAQLRSKLVEAMGKGGQFHVARFVGWQMPGVSPTVLEWKLDEAGSKITGRMVADGRALGTNEKLATSYEGEVKQDQGWITLQLLQVSPFHAYDRIVGALKLFVSEDRSGVLHLNGHIVNLGTVPNDKPLPAFPTKFDRCVELIPVTAVDPQTRAAIDKAISDVAKVKADADAAASAAQTAALAARRTKLAPFFALFKARPGLVITTDAPMELGTVILESRVDEQEATISGKGIDLREMPFRDFTFETGLDNWGNLTVSPSIAKAAYAFAAPKDPNMAAGRGVTLKLLSDAERARLDGIIKLGQRLQGAPQAILTVATLDATAAKAQEAGLKASDLPGVAIYKDKKSDPVAAMFTAKSNGRFRWVKEPLTLRLIEPARGKALYIKGGGPTDNLTVVINGVHRASIAAMVQLGGATISLPPDLEILDLRLEAGGTAQARGVVLVK